MPEGTVPLQTLPDGTTERARRAPGSGTPCRRCPKIPPGADPKPENACDWGERETRAYEFWKECQATGDVPTDPLARRHARLFAEAEEGVQTALAERRHQELLIALRKR